MHSLRHLRHPLRGSLLIMQSMDSLTDENRLVFVKTDKIGPVRFYRFTKN
jgi:hypothetical protein